MLLIADSGGTKTLWYGLEQGLVRFSLESPGLNPMVLEEKALDEALLGALTAVLEAGWPIRQLDFYGAGCGSSEGQRYMYPALRRLFPQAEINLAGDLWAAALALCGQGSGICCILGTGSNSVLWEAGREAARIPSLGYILGDEGGGVDLGRRLLQAYFYRQMPEDLASILAQNFVLQEPFVLQQVYKQGRPNGYLAHFVPFIAAHLDQYPFLQALVSEAMDSFVQNHVLPYGPAACRLPVHALGGVVASFEAYWRQALARRGLQGGRVLRQPFPDLLRLYGWPNTEDQ